MKGLSHEMGMAYYRKGEYVRAAGYFRQAIEQDPQDGEATQLRGCRTILAADPATRFLSLSGCKPGIHAQTWTPPTFWANATSRPETTCMRE